LLAADKLRDRQIVRAPEQSDGRFCVACFPDPEADPAAVRQYVVPLGEPRADQFIPHGARERHVEQDLAVEMTEFALA
jgi:hypothetical protein